MNLSDLCVHDYLSIKIKVLRVVGDAATQAGKESAVEIVVLDNRLRVVRCR